MLKGSKEMYCEKCNWEGEGNFCPWCGNKAVSEKSYKQEEGAFQMQDKNWYYSFNGETQGPVSETELLKMLETGYINESTMVWKQGFQGWVTIEQAGISIPKNNAAVVKKISNKPIVFLVFVPIISSLLQYLLAGWFEISADKLVWIAYILNVIFCLIDYSRVKKAGYDMSKLNLAFLLFIPLYIYKRVQLVNGRKWTLAILWTAILIIDMVIPAQLWVKMVNMSNPQMITAIKEGHFDGYKDVTVEKIFEKSLENCTWKTYLDNNKEILVEVSGVLNIEANGTVTTYNLDTVFKLNMDSSYEVVSMKDGVTSYSNEDILKMIAYLYGVQQSKE